jgi:hypothetical protein
MSFEEYSGWMEYAKARPFGWQADNRAAVIAMSMAGSGKVQPEDLFLSLKQMKEYQSEKNKTTLFKSFLSRFKGQLVDSDPDFERIPDD